MLFGPFKSLAKFKICLSFVFNFFAILISPPFKLCFLLICPMKKLNGMNNFFISTMLFYTHCHLEHAAWITHGNHLHVFRHVLHLFFQYSTCHFWVCHIVNPSTTTATI